LWKTIQSERYSDRRATSDVMTGTERAVKPRVAYQLTSIAGVVRVARGVNSLIRLPRHATYTMAVDRQEISITYLALKVKQK